VSVGCCEEEEEEGFKSLEVRLRVHAFNGRRGARGLERVVGKFVDVWPIFVDIANVIVILREEGGDAVGFIAGDEEIPNDLEAVLCVAEGLCCDDLCSDEWGEYDCCRDWSADEVRFLESFRREPGEVKVGDGVEIGEVFVLSLKILVLSTM